MAVFYRLDSLQPAQVPPARRPHPASASSPGGLRLFASTGERSVDRIGGGFGVRLCAKIVEMSGLGVILHSGKMDGRLGSRVPYPADMDRSLGSPALSPRDMSPSLLRGLISPGRGADSAMGIRIFRLSRMSWFWGSAMNGSGTAAFFLRCGRFGMGTGSFCGAFFGCGAGRFLH